MECNNPGCTVILIHTDRVPAAHVPLFNADAMHFPEAKWHAMPHSNPRLLSHLQS